jgi:hypothetical protein
VASSRNGGAWPAAAIGEAVLVFVLALLVRLDAATGQPPQPDELYHFYAARSVLADGSFTVFSGIYLRAAEFTRLVAAAMGLFGESLAAARIPSCSRARCWSLRCISGCGARPGAAWRRWRPPC